MNQYLFGFERYYVCRNCPGATRFITKRPGEKNQGSWSYCDLCGFQPIIPREWYLRWTL